MVGKNAACFRPSDGQFRGAFSVASQKSPGITEFSLTQKHTATHPSFSSSPVSFPPSSSLLLTSSVPGSLFQTLLSRLRVLLVLLPHSLLLFWLFLPLHSFLVLGGGGVLGVAPLSGLTSSMISSCRMALSTIPKAPTPKFTSPDQT